MWNISQEALNFTFNKCFANLTGEEHPLDTARKAFTSELRICTLPKLQPDRQAAISRFNKIVTWFTIAKVFMDLPERNGMENDPEDGELSDEEDLSWTYAVEQWSDWFGK